MIGKHLFFKRHRILFEANALPGAFSAWTSFLTCCPALRTQQSEMNDPLLRARKISKGDKSRMGTLKIQFMSTQPDMDFKSPWLRGRGIRNCFHRRDKPARTEDVELVCEIVELAEKEAKSVLQLWGWIWLL